MTGLLDKSAQAATAAHLLFEAGLYADAVSRAYYAMFDAAQAFLAGRGFVNPPRVKSHARIVSLFSRASIEGNEIPVEHARALSRALAARIDADYEQQEVPREIASRILTDMDAFVAHVRSALEGTRG
ncbi:MAG: HEPN domain-containing protein [Alphaproteobacteria bacterium]|nr:MAG: HEPN domain-containing protein [Alphaproteobacteria bacterium]